MVGEEKQHLPTERSRLESHVCVQSTNPSSVPAPSVLSLRCRAAVEKPKGPSRRSSRADKEVEEEPVADSGTRKRSARPGAAAAVKGECPAPQHPHPSPWPPLAADYAVLSSRELDSKLTYNYLLKRYVSSVCLHWNGTRDPVRHHQ